MQNFLFKSTKEDSPLKATDFGLSDYIKPGMFMLKENCFLLSMALEKNVIGLSVAITVVSNISSRPQLLM